METITLNKLVDNFLNIDEFRNQFDNCYYKLYKYVEDKELRYNVIEKIGFKFISNKSRLDYLLINYLNGYLDYGIILCVTYYKEHGVLPSYITKEFLEQLFMEEDVSYTNYKLCKTVTKYVSMKLVDIFTQDVDVEGLLICVYEKLQLHPNHLIDSEKQHLMIIYATKYKCFKFMRYLLDHGASFMNSDDVFYMNITNEEHRYIFGIYDEIKENIYNGMNKQDFIKDPQKSMFYKTVYIELYQYYVEKNDISMLQRLQKFDLSYNQVTKIYNMMYMTN